MLGSVKYLTLSISNNYKQVIKTKYLCGAWTLGSFPHKTYQINDHICKYCKFIRPTRIKFFR